MKVTKPIDLALLQQELDAAGVQYRVLVAMPTGQPNELDITDQSPVDGSPIELPPESVPVIDAHVAPPRVIDFAGQRDVDALVRTTDDVPREVFRFQTQPRQIYDAVFRMSAFDAVSGTTKRTSAEVVFRRTQTTLVQVGSTYVPATFQEPASTPWAILPTVSGTDLVISVRGAVGRTIDWLLTGTIGTYAPEGLPPPPAPPVI